jgi:signal transduction histidine kinase
MFKQSIFGQLFIFTVAAFIASFLFIGAVLSGYLGDYLMKRQENNLKSVTQNVENLTVNFRQNNLSASFYRSDAYRSYINLLSELTNTYIFVLNTEGRVVAATKGRTNVSLGREYYEAALREGNTPQSGNLGGVFNASMLSLGAPITDGDEVVGAVIASLDFPEISGMRHEILNVFILSVLVVLAAALIFMYSMSRRLSDPLRRLNRAAKRLAGGAFDERVEVAEKNEIGELAETFNFMAKSLGDLENMRSSFVANVSHELRTPMTTISGFVEGILDGTIAEEKRGQYLEIVLDESRRLSRLVSDLLDLDKIERNNQPLDLKEFDVNELLRLNLIKLERRVEDKRLNVEVEFENDPQKALAEKDSIQRVVVNLLDNAVKFADEGGYIGVKTGTSGNDVFVAVENSGLGMEPDELERIFDRFYKTDKSRSADKIGVGLGLYIVKNIIKNHGKQIWAESALGEYTRFTFTLQAAAGNNKKEKEKENKN